jgi:hypothetical protein
MRRACQHAFRTTPSGTFPRKRAICPQAAAAICTTWAPDGQSGAIADRRPQAELSFLIRSLYEWPKLSGQYCESGRLTAGFEPMERDILFSFEADFTGG